MDAGKLSKFANRISFKVNTIPLVLRIFVWIFLWPILLGVFLLRKPNLLFLRVAAAVLVIALFQYQWLSAFYSSFNVARSVDNQPEAQPMPSISAIDSPSDAPSQAPLIPVVKIELSDFQSNCNESRMLGMITVANNGNVDTSGRVSVPVSSFEKYEIPLSGIFLSIEANTKQSIKLESDFECKEGQVFGDPRVDFTYPSGVDASIGVKNAFEWSNFSYKCDSASELISFKATVKNISSNLISAGVIARLSTEEVNYTIDYWSPISKLAPGESREIDFGYDGVCNVQRGGTKGPYEPSFEVVYSY
jgi:hypothetical protein